MEKTWSKKGLDAQRRGATVSKPVWIVNRPSVVSEVIDGELVVMNLSTGNYFSSAGTGAALWACLEAGMAAESLAARLVARHGLAPAAAEADVERFLERLRAESLVREAEPGAAVAVPAADGAVREAYEPPQMHVYSDMRDLLMLDPIHDVAAEGWPSRPAEELKQAG